MSDLKLYKDSKRWRTANQGVASALAWEVSWRNANYVNTPRMAAVMPAQLMPENSHYLDYTGDAYIVPGHHINALTDTRYMQAFYGSKAWPSIEMLTSFFPLHEHYYFLRIADDNYQIPYSLKGFYDLITESGYISTLAAGWNEANALSISKDILESALRFLIQYVLDCYYNGDKKVLSIPEINPAPNNSIDISWRATGGRMLVNIKKQEEEILAFFYGDQYNNKSQIKGNVLTNEFAPHLALWMKNNLI